jgi:hypothetical protein
MGLIPLNDVKYIPPFSLTDELSLLENFKKHRQIRYDGGGLLPGLYLGIRRDHACSIPMNQILSFYTFAIV